MNVLLTGGAGYIGSHVVRALNAAGVASDRTVRVLEMRGQPPDHPIAANCPETAYLKCFICVVGK